MKTTPEETARAAEAAYKTELFALRMVRDSGLMSQAEYEARGAKARQVFEAVAPKGSSGKRSE